LSGGGEDASRPTVTAELSQYRRSRGAAIAQFHVVIATAGDSTNTYYQSLKRQLVGPWFLHGVVRNFVFRTDFALASTGWRKINRTIYFCGSSSVFLQQNT